MNNRRKKKLRNRIIWAGVCLAYAAVLAFLILTAGQPSQIIVTASADQLTMDGLSKAVLSVSVVDNDGLPMSGQIITFTKLRGSGKIQVIRNTTLGTEEALGEYTAGYGTEEGDAEILIENETGLSKTVLIREVLAQASISQIIIQPVSVEEGKDITITMQALDSDGQPVPKRRLLIRLDNGTGGFSGFRMLNKITDEEGFATIKYKPAGACDAEITVLSEEDDSVFATVCFSVP